LAHCVYLFLLQRLIEIGIGEVENPDILASLIGPGKIILSKFGKQTEFLGAPSRHANLFAVQVCDRLQAKIRMTNNSNSAFGKTRDSIDRGSLGAPGDRGVERTRR
jgi:hypothetical protein